MPTTARGIIFTGPREVALETFEVADPGPHQALVRLTRTLVSAGTEISALLGQGRSARWPMRPGYSNVGVVERVGLAVEDVRPGDRVLCTGRHASHTLVDLDPAQLLRLGEGTQDQLERAPQYAQPIPDGVPDDAAAFAVLGSVALHGFRKVSFQPGESCAVVGQGVVGQLLGQLAVSAGARPTIGIDLVASRLERSKQSGLHAAIDGSTQDVETEALALTAGRGADVVFEATRSPRGFPTALHVAALGGRVVMVGSVHAMGELHLFDDLQRKELTIIGAWQPRAPIRPHQQYRWTQPANRQLFMEMLRAGTVRVEHLITHRAEADEAPALYAEMAAGAGEWMGVLFAWD